MSRVTYDWQASARTMLSQPILLANEVSNKLNTASLLISSIFFNAKNHKVLENALWSALNRCN